MFGVCTGQFRLTSFRSSSAIKTFFVDPSLTLCDPLAQVSCNLVAKGSALCVEGCGDRVGLERKFLLYLTLWSAQKQALNVCMPGPRGSH